MSTSNGKEKRKRGKEEKRKRGKEEKRKRGKEEKRNCGKEKREKSKEKRKAERKTRQEKKKEKETKIKKQNKKKKNEEIERKRERRRRDRGNVLGIVEHGKLVPFCSLVQQFCGDELPRFLQPMDRRRVEARYDFHQAVEVVHFLAVNCNLQPKIHHIGPQPHVFCLENL